MYKEYLIDFYHQNYTTISHNHNLSEEEATKLLNFAEDHFKDIEFIPTEEQIIDCCWLYIGRNSNTEVS